MTISVSLSLSLDGLGKNRFIVRDFTYDEGAIQKSRRELEDLIQEEKQQWVQSLSHFYEPFPKAITDENWVDLL